MAAGVEEVMQDGADGVHAHHLDGGVLLFEVAPGAGDGPAGAEAADEVGDAAVGLAPQFGAGGTVMGRGVGGVVVLVAQDGAGDLARQALGDLVICLLYTSRCV